MSDLADTSYYEIALTNRQVVVAFVILLTLVLAVFLCGVWVGQNGQARLADIEPAPAGEGAESPALANMEEFKFFEEQQAKKEEDLQKPDLGKLAAKPSPQTTLAQDVGSSRPADTPPPRQAPAQAAPARAAPQPAPAKVEPRPASPPPRQAPPPPKPAPRQAAPAQTAPPPAAAGETFVVQVFSTHDEPQAVKLQQRLQQMRYRAFMSTIDVGGQTMYRVRIGPFTERNRAEKVKIDVRNQLKLDPWVTAASN